MGIYTLKDYDSHEGMGAACYLIGTICLLSLSLLGFIIYTVVS